MLTNNDKENSEIREVVQEVLKDVISSMSETADEVLDKETPPTETTKKDDENKNTAEESVTATKKDNEENAITGCGAPGSTDPNANAITSNDQTTGTDIAPAVTSSTTTPNVTAIPKSEVLDSNGSNLGTPGVAPKVNDLPTTTDVDATQGNTTGEVNTNLINSGRDSTATDYVPPTTAVPSTHLPVDTDTSVSVTETVESGSMNHFGTEITYTKNEDGTYNVTFSKDGNTRVTNLTCIDASCILPELEDFLVEVYSDKPQDTQGAVTEAANMETLPVETLPPVIPDDPSAIAPNPEGVVEPAVESAMTDDPFANAATEDEEAKEELEEALSNSTNAMMSSLRKQYADKVMEIFQLGLQTKSTILAESKNKIFAKDVNEYKKKDAIIAGEIKDKKALLSSLTQKYLKARKERDNIRSLVSILAATVQKGQRGLSEGNLTDNNSEKIVETLRGIVSKVVNSYGKKNFSSILARSIDKAKNVRYVVAMEISQSKKRAMIAEKHSAQKKKEFNIETNRSSSVLASRTIAANRRTRKPGVVVQNGYLSRGNGTIARTRYDGTDEMIGEISGLI